MVLAAVERLTDQRARKILASGQTGSGRRRIVIALIAPLSMRPHADRKEVRRRNCNSEGGPELR
jgi:hypothetical protein